jgi:hypothetical protein
MAPEGTPEAFLDRETLWNAAEAADRRMDSRTAREVLVSLPHELSDEQRHDLLRAFIAEGLTAKGMIADYAIHRPDAHGDPRNHHAHIMITTREVGPEGFGRKGRSWDNPEAVRDLRRLWAEIQNRHLREHLGAEAPQVTHISLSGQGEAREPTVHLGPAASGMERRGEASDRGDTNRKIAERNAERAAGPRRIEELEDQLARSHARRAYPIDAVIAEFKMIHETMARERAAWVQELGDQRVGQGLRGGDVTREVLGDSARQRAAAARRLTRSQARIELGRMRRAGLARWIANPARMIWAAHAELNRLERDQRAFEQADAICKVRRAWLGSEAGRAYIAARVHPAGQAREDALRSARTLERKIKRADARIEKVAGTRTRLLVAKELGQKELTAPSELRVGIGQAVREVDRRLAEALRTYRPEAQQAALGRVMGALRREGPTIER